LTDERFDGEAVDPGEPVAELADLGEPAPRGFFERVVRSVERRLLASEAFDMTWFGIGQIFREYWEILAALLGGGRDNRGETER